MPDSPGASPVNCPTDGAVLQLAERHGVEIDHCPDCRGIWLDRGELDKILDRLDAEPRRSDDHRDEPRGKRKRGGFLGELFELGS